MSLSHRIKLYARVGVGGVICWFNWRGGSFVFVSFQELLPPCRPVRICIPFALLMLPLLFLLCVRASSAAAEGGWHDEQRGVRSHGPGGEVYPPRQVQEGQGEPVDAPLTDRCCKRCHACYGGVEVALFRQVFSL